MRKFTLSLPMPTDAEGCILGALKAIGAALVEITGALPAGSDDHRGPRGEMRRRTQLLLWFLGALLFVGMFWWFMR